MRWWTSVAVVAAVLLGQAKAADPDPDCACAGDCATADWAKDWAKRQGKAKAKGLSAKECREKRFAGKEGEATATLLVKMAFQALPGKELCPDPAGKTFRGAKPEQLQGWLYKVLPQLLGRDVLCVDFQADQRFLLVINSKEKNVQDCLKIEKALKDELASNLKNNNEGPSYSYYITHDSCEDDWCRCEGGCKIAFDQALDKDRKARPGQALGEDMDKGEADFCLWPDGDLKKLSKAQKDTIENRKLKESEINFNFQTKLPLMMCPKAGDGKALTRNTAREGKATLAYAWRELVRANQYSEEGLGMTANEVTRCLVTANEVVGGDDGGIFLRNIDLLLEYQDAATCRAAAVALRAATEKSAALFHARLSDNHAYRINPFQSIPGSLTKRYKMCDYPRCVECGDCAEAADCNKACASEADKAECKKNCAKTNEAGKEKCTKTCAEAADKADCEACGAERPLALKPCADAQPQHTILLPMFMWSCVHDKANDNATEATHTKMFFFATAKELFPSLRAAAAALPAHLAASPACLEAPEDLECPGLCSFFQLGLHQGEKKEEKANLGLCEARNELHYAFLHNLKVQGAITLDESVGSTRVDECSCEGCRFGGVVEGRECEAMVAAAAHRPDHPACRPSATTVVFEIRLRGRLCRELRDASGHSVRRPQRECSQAGVDRYKDDADREAEQQTEQTSPHDPKPETKRAKRSRGVARRGGRRRGGAGRGGGRRGGARNVKVAKFLYEQPYVLDLELTRHAAVQAGLGNSRCMRNMRRRRVAGMRKLREEVLRRIWRWALRREDLVPVCFALKRSRAKGFHYTLAVDVSARMTGKDSAGKDTDKAGQCKQTMDELKERLRGVPLPAFQPSTKATTIKEEGKEVDLLRLGVTPNAASCKGLCGASEKELNVYLGLRSDARCTAEEKPDSTIALEVRLSAGARTCDLSWSPETRLANETTRRQLAAFIRRFTETDDLCRHAARTKDEKKKASLKELLKCWSAERDANGDVLVHLRYDTAEAVQEGAASSTAAQDPTKRESAQQQLKQNLCVKNGVLVDKGITASVKKDICTEKVNSEQGLKVYYAMDCSDFDRDATHVALLDLAEAEETCGEKFLADCPKPPPVAKRSVPPKRSGPWLDLIPDLEVPKEDPVHLTKCWQRLARILEKHVQSMGLELSLPKEWKTSKDADKYLVAAAKKAYEAKEKPQEPRRNARKKQNSQGKANIPMVMAACFDYLHRPSDTVIGVKFHLVKRNAKLVRSWVPGAGELVPKGDPALGGVRTFVPCTRKLQRMPEVPLFVPPEPAPHCGELCTEQPVFALCHRARMQGELRGTPKAVVLTLDRLASPYCREDEKHSHVRRRDGSVAELELPQPAQKVGCNCEASRCPFDTRLRGDWQGDFHERLQDEVLAKYAYKAWPGRAGSAAGRFHCLRPVRGPDEDGALRALVALELHADRPNLEPKQATPKQATHADPGAGNTVDNADLAPSGADGTDNIVDNADLTPPTGNALVDNDHWEKTIRPKWQTILNIDWLTAPENQRIGNQIQMKCTGTAKVEVEGRAVEMKELSTKPSRAEGKPEACPFCVGQPDFAVRMEHCDSDGWPPGHRYYRVVLKETKLVSVALKGKAGGGKDFEGLHGLCGLAQDYGLYADQQNHLEATSFMAQIYNAFEGLKKRVVCVERPVEDDKLQCGRSDPARFKFFQNNTTVTVYFTEWWEERGVACDAECRAKAPTQLNVADVLTALSTTSVLVAQSSDSAARYQPQACEPSDGSMERVHFGRVCSEECRPAFLTADGRCADVGPAGVRLLRFELSLILRGKYCTSGGCEDAHNPVAVDFERHMDDKDETRARKNRKAFFMMLERALHWSQLGAEEAEGDGPARADTGAQRVHVLCWDRPDKPALPVHKDHEEASRERWQKNGGHYYALLQVVPAADSQEEMERKKKLDPVKRAEAERKAVAGIRDALGGRLEAFFRRDDFADGGQIYAGALRGGGDDGGTQMGTEPLDERLAVEVSVSGEVKDEGGRLVWDASRGGCDSRSHHAYLRFLKDFLCCPKDDFCKMATDESEEPAPTELAATTRAALCKELQCDKADCKEPSDGPSEGPSADRLKRAAQPQKRVEGRYKVLLADVLQRRPSVAAREGAVLARILSDRLLKDPTATTDRNYDHVKVMPKNCDHSTHEQRERYEGMINCEVPACAAWDGWATYCDGVGRLPNSTDTAAWAQLLPVNVSLRSLPWGYCSVWAGSFRPTELEDQRALLSLALKRLVADPSPGRDGRVWDPVVEKTPKVPAAIRVFCPATDAQGRVLSDKRLLYVKLVDPENETLGLRDEPNGHAYVYAVAVKNNLAYVRSDPQLLQQTPLQLPPEEQYQCKGAAGVAPSILLLLLHTLHTL